MGLFDKDKPTAQFFLSTKVTTVRQRAIDIEAQKEQERIKAANRRIRKQIKREEKARKVRERKEERQRLRTEKRQQRERKKEDRIQ